MAVATLFLYLPGFFVGKALRFDSLLALACAPVASVAAFTLLAVVYGAVGVPCTWLNMLLPLVIVFGALFAVVLRRSSDKPARITRAEWMTVALYVAIGLALCLFVFVKSLDGPASFHCRNDNITHLNLVRAFHESGIWSTLTTSNFLASDPGEGSYAGTEFYPAAWHVMVALVMSLTECDVTVAVNAMNAVVAGVVYPLSMAVFMRSLFPKKPLVVVAGAFVALGFTAFPWGFLIKGPLFPNLLSFALLPSVLAVLVNALERIPIPKSTLVRSVVFALVSIVALALSQANALFTAFVFAVPLVCCRLHGYFAARQGKHGTGPRANMTFYVIYAVVVALLWVAMFTFPALSRVTMYELPQDVNLSIVNALFNMVSFSFMTAFPQWLLVGVTAIGAICLIASKKTWMVLPGAYMLVTYVLAKSVFGLPKQLLAGFWYSDPWRIAACAALFLVPVAAVGLAALATTAANWIGRLTAPDERASSQRHPTRRNLVLCSVSVLLAFSLVNYFPTYTELRNDDKFVTSFGYVKKRLSTSYSQSREQVYSAEEEAFVKKAQDAIPEDAVVVNVPVDGSVLAYGVDGLNTYFRYKFPKALTDESAVIRNGIGQISEKPDVRAAAENAGVEYVLLLDQGATLEDGKWFDYQTQQGLDDWKSIMSITDETPGFEVVLAEDDMRLYKIL
ncbi:hypothetical protein GMI70_02525 [Eggerthellaceae bacterium zg-893]|nr:hypothetical protein [Eggerthellaceae bacterium zg-893]